ncbi:MAG: hypothetical protein JSS65_14015 [Armatimonadetes bacterium]|nr:hypothetical protein [Armatimonadota bacterium]
MYLLTWNPDESRIEASFGGCITKGEAVVFDEELTDMVKSMQGQIFSVVVDYATASRIEDRAKELLNECRERCIFGGAHKVTFVTRDEREAQDYTNNRLQAVLEGREEYVAYGMAA